MKHRSSLAIVFGGIVLGCRPNVVMTAPAAATPQRDEASESPEVELDDVALAITLAVHLVDPPHVEVFVRLEGGASRFVLRAPVAAAYSILGVRDDAGEIPHRVEAGETWVLTLGRVPRGSVHLAYRLDAPTVDASARVPSFYMNPATDEAHLAGESILWLPEGRGPMRHRLEIETGSSEELEVATSFGVGRSVTGELAPEAIARTNVLVGRLDTARFRSFQGQDDVATLGISAFDPRWVAAETAGVRTAVAEYFGVVDSSRFATLILLGLRPPNTTPYAAVLRTKSLVVDGAAWAPWSGAARLLVAHALVHRFVGGRVRIAADRVGEGVWFAQGFSRYVAREVLVSLGLLTDEEIVAELNALEGVLATSPLRTASNRVVVEHGSPEAVALVTARGALYAARLRARIERHDSSRQGLRALLMTLIRDAENERAIGLDAWERLIGERAGAEEVLVFRGAILEGRPFDVPADAFGPCFRPTRGTHVPFDLGFDDPGFVGAPVVIETVEPGGPAHAGGLRPGDTIVDLTYRVGDPTIAVEATVERGGERSILRWLPRGQVVRGRRWIRAPRVPDEFCS